MKSTTKATVHPLIKYIRNWEAFNRAARKTNYLWFYIFVGSLFIAMMIDILL